MQGLLSIAAAVCMVMLLCGVGYCEAAPALNSVGCPVGRAGPPACLEPYYLSPGEPRPPGTLLLNMLIKNEREHLDRTLPQWAKIIDYWIIGVDDHNTDDSAEIIMKHLGHIPGEMVIVAFDGMGPTWSILVNTSIEKYPHATHGLLADADFAPGASFLDKMELDIRCSKHMYTIWTEDYRNERKMDWIYRNIPGAVVKRRTHQVLEVPALEPQEVFQTLISLPITERAGGYGDRTGKKQERYIGFLEKDLIDYPGDTRTLYYLGYAHFEIYQNNAQNPSQEHKEHLSRAIEYFDERADLDTGNEEERWFAILKLGEIYERFFNDWSKAGPYYERCIELDPERADGWFYAGQHYRLYGKIEKSLEYLHKAATLPMPERSLFQWHFLYQCLGKLEYARAVNQLKTTPTRAMIKEAKSILRTADCREGDPGNMAERTSLLEVFASKLAKKPPTGHHKLKYPIKKMITLLVKNKAVVEPALSAQAFREQEIVLGGSSATVVAGEGEDDDDEEEDVEWDDELNAPVHTAPKQKNKEKKLAISQEDSVYGAVKAHVVTMQKFIKGGDDTLTCREYRLATKGFLSFMDEHKRTVDHLLKSHTTILSTWDQNVARIRKTCR